MKDVFKIVRDGRDIGVKTVQEAIAAGRPIAGWEVDHAVRVHIKNAGFGDNFIHRTGHSIGTDVHANGANMDDLEIHDERRILPNSCFSIEPGIYLPEFGVRSEVDVLVRPKRGSYRKNSKRASHNLNGKFHRGVNRERPKPQRRNRSPRWRCSRPWLAG